MRTPHPAAAERATRGTTRGLRGEQHVVRRRGCRWRERVRTHVYSRGSLAGESVAEPLERCRSRAIFVLSAHFNSSVGAVGV